MTYTVQRRDNSAATHWHTCVKLAVVDVPALNREAGWQKYRVAEGAIMTCQQHGSTCIIGVDNGAYSLACGCTVDETGHPPKLPDTPAGLIDMRNGPQDHACAGSWHYMGLNAGGHELYNCDSGRHYGLAAHVSATHVCGPECVELLPMPHTTPADSNPGSVPLVSREDVTNGE